MTMDIEEFERTEDGGSNLSTSEAIVKFLLENSEQAWKRGEIAEEINRDPNTVGTNLSRLKDRGLVRHRKNHWAITDDHHQLVEAVRFSNTLSTLNETVGPIIESEEEAKTWSNAQPERAHPSVSDVDEATETEGDNTDDK
ncbi:winged helix-turn-helix domain-containing protein [Halorubrum sp. ARQ200]|uniref:winged helix-turn-helix domain-containing protein n=1 Tax=Halorubrum sp. ARQ200 TaxID=1855872 RepID=UPI0010F71D9D|nr:winged helix-turn-helix domain-containing protein [Halorubrum sp. ARQ200]TKX43730.1 ArsR family transcriptional regulator [Halorubrum sp. ARQ200]